MDSFEVEERMEYLSRCKKELQQAFDLAWISHKEYINELLTLFKELESLTLPNHKENVSC